MINNFQSLNITKLDVLSGLSTIRIGRLAGVSVPLVLFHSYLLPCKGTHYRLRGERLPRGMMPSVLEDLAQVQVEYESKHWAIALSS